MLSYNVTGFLQLVLFCPALALPGILLGIFLRRPDAAASAPLASGYSNDENWRFHLFFSPNPEQYVGRVAVRPDIER